MDFLSRKVRIINSFIVIIKACLCLQFEPQAPITTPIYGVPQPTPEQGPPGAPMNFGGYSGLYNPQEHQAPPQPVRTLQAQLIPL
jgi:hypothetical protein